MRTLLSVAVVSVLLPIPAAAQGSINLLVNTAAENGSFGWRSDGEVTVEEFEGHRCFVLRNGARLTQEVELPPDSPGKSLLLIAHVFGERTDRPNDITDRPYLYGLMFSPDLRRILLHNQAASMGALAVPPGLWGKSWGVFTIPEGASSIAFQLGQGCGAGLSATGVPRVLTTSGCSSLTRVKQRRRSPGGIGECRLTSRWSRRRR
jgi:hypothetical protein